jgi:hypothetical protein
MATSAQILEREAIVLTRQSNNELSLLLLSGQGTVSRGLLEAVPGNEHGLDIFWLRSGDGTDI